MTNILAFGFAAGGVVGAFFPVESEPWQTLALVALTVLVTILAECETIRKVLEARK